jgi:hypothetical protein
VLYRALSLSVYCLERLWLNLRNSQVSRIVVFSPLIAQIRENVNDEIRDQSETSHNAGGSGSPDRSASPLGGGGDNNCHQNDRQTEARERAMMKALDLIEESNEVLQLADGHPGVHLFGQSKENARPLLNNVKACRMEFRELRIP